MEKMQYERPETEVVYFESEDIITTSTETPEVGNIGSSMFNLF